MPDVKESLQSLHNPKLPREIYVVYTVIGKKKKETEEQFNQALSEYDYDKAYELIAKIQPTLAKLFDEVKILADDPAIQKNRIALLQKVLGLFAKVIDFSKIKG